MKVLTKSADIRSAIRVLLADSNDIRIVVAAFVGKDALSFLPSPAGLVVYCWPKAGGSNPHGIDLLRDADVRVHFVDRLHAKIYWSKARGTIIGSANLTANALGDEGLSEAVVQLPAGQFDINRFVNALSVIPDFDAALERLRVEHVRFLMRNPLKFRGRSKDDTSVVKNFDGWARGSSAGQDWRLGWYDDSADPPKDTIARYEEITNTRKYADYLGVKRKDDLKEGVPTLTFSVKSNRSMQVRVAGFRWWYPEVPTITTVRSWRDYPHVWFAKRLVPLRATVPFNCKELRFRKAIADSINELGGMSWLIGASRKPSKRFLSLLRRHYGTES